MEIEISRRDSDTLKGFFILLIIIGHNHILSPIGSPLMIYLYKFHVIAFFVLPFLYSNLSGKLNFLSIRDYVIRNYIPYFYFFCLAFIVFHLGVKKDGLIGFDFITGFISGSQSVLKQTTGFYFLWFLPAFFAVTLVRLFFDNSGFWIKSLIILSTVFLQFISSYQLNVFFKLIPFSLVQGMYYFGFGLITILLLKYIPYAKYIGAILFIISTGFYLNGAQLSIPFLFPVSFFLFSLTILNWLNKIVLLQKLGYYSLPIYLLNVFIYNLVEKFFINNVFYGIITLVLTASLSYLTSYFLLKMPVVRKLIFPHSWFELKNFYINR